MQEIRNMSHDEQIRRLEELRTELSKLHTTIRAGGSINNPGKIRAIKKTIARILTTLQEEEYQL
jgi:large subunit ribosomal protein L29